MSLKQARNTENDTTSRTSDGHHRAEGSLTPRQRQIIALLQAGKANKEIANELGIGLGTVKQHMAALFKKMNVTNRSMAVSKSLTMEQGPPHLSWASGSQAQIVQDDDRLIERRPAAVLSLSLSVSGQRAENHICRELYKIFAEVAFDFDAVCLPRRDGKCDMVFGIHQVRRHDVLRAVRAGVAVSESFKQITRTGYSLKAGLAYGYVLASTAEDGEWTGETISGSLITKTRQIATNAENTELRLHHTAQSIISSLGFHIGGTVPDAIALKPEFRWEREMPVHQARFVGRVPELEKLRSELLKEKTADVPVKFLEGESGMGKSALIQKFIEKAERDGYLTDVWFCSLPDSQPGIDALGQLEHPESGQSIPASQFANYLSTHPRAQNQVLIVEDTHLLPEGDFQTLSHIFASLSSRPALMVMTYRGRIPASSVSPIQSQVLRLGRLGIAESHSIAGSFLGTGHSAKQWLSDMAQGVPGFMVELSRFIKSEITEGRSGLGQVPPPALFSMIAERIERHKLDRRLLFIFANNNSPLNPAELCQQYGYNSSEFDIELQRMLKSGVLKCTEMIHQKPVRIDFSHPLLRWVLASAFVPKTQFTE